MATSDDAIGGEFVIQAREQLEAAVFVIRHCLDQLDDEQVWSRAGGKLNSIANLLLHLSGNLRQRFRAEIAGEPDARDRPLEFTERRSIPKADLQAGFEEAAGLADEVLAALAPAQLLETRRTERATGFEDRSVLGLALMTIAHLHGHAQEILYMTRVLLGDRYVFRHPAVVPPEMRADR